MKTICKTSIIFIIVILMMASFNGCTEMELYNDAGEVAKNTSEGIEGLAVEVFNSSFENYIGTNKKATIIQRFIELAIERNKDESFVVDVSLSLNGSEYTSDEEELTQMKEDVSSESKYTTKIEEKNKEGYITKISIVAE